MIKYNYIKWRLYNNVLIPDVEPHFNLDLTSFDAKILLKKSKAFFIRWTSEFDSEKHYPFWWVIKDDREDETLRGYSAKIRSEIRRGLKNNECYLLDNYDILDTEIIKNLYSVYINAFKRYRRLYIQPLDFIEFKRNLRSDLDRKEFWIVKSKVYRNRIIAYGEALITGRTVFYNEIKADSEFISLYPIYCLVYNMNRYYLNERNFLYVHDGTKSLGHVTNIHEWLIKKFKFRKARCRLNIIYRDDIKVLTQLLYPLRNILNKINNKLFFKLNVLFNHEEIRRQCERIHKFY